jgi:hypothetical protein
VQLLDIGFASKTTLKPQLCSLLNIPVSAISVPASSVSAPADKKPDPVDTKPDPDDTKQGIFSLVERLTEKLEDNITFVTEFPYVDRHYRDTYYSYFSSKFIETGRNCIRVHIFEGTLTEDDILKKESKLNNRYYGFFIIRPLVRRLLGRSLISPKAFRQKQFFCCLMKGRVSLLGNELIVHGHPHIAQDTETHTCAESALWCLYEYYGSKYSQYRPLLPSQIIEPLRNNTERRLLPSRGLTEKELAQCLNSNGFQSLSYPINYKEKEPDLRRGYKHIFRMINTYIESGIPLLMSVGGEKGGHTVLVIGHEEDDAIYYKEGDNRWTSDPEEDPWVDVSFIPKKLVFIDDNLPPYYISDLLDSANQTPKMYRKMTVSSFIVPLPAHMFLTAENAYDMITLVLKDPTFGLRARGGKWVTRLLLTSGYSFKEFIFNHDNKLAPDYRDHLLKLPLSRFIWICEIYEAKDYVKDGYCSRLLIIDATSDGEMLASVLFYTSGETIMEHDGIYWKPPKPEDVLIPFKMITYKHNLKGVWNQWKAN